MMKLKQKTEMYRKQNFSTPYPIKSARAHLRTVRDCPLPTLWGALFEDHCAWGTISWRVLCGQQSYADGTIPWRLLRRGRSCGRHTETTGPVIQIVSVNTFRKIISRYGGSSSFRNSFRKYLRKMVRKKRRCYYGNLSFYYRHH